MHYINLAILFALLNTSYWLSSFS